MQWRDCLTRTGKPEGCDVEGTELARLCGVAGLRPTSAEPWPEMTHPETTLNKQTGAGARRIDFLCTSVSADAGPA